MASKDQAIGGAICLVCVVVGVLYAAGLFYFGGNPLDWGLTFTLIAVPVFVAFIAIMGIGAWIGWTMATTPPPKPIEEITSEIETEQKATEEKTAAQETSPPPPEAEKKPEKKRKTE
jgi:cytoskeletal protein RodZ